MPKVSCIIPAYNEESRIGKVLQAACGHPLIAEIIVVDDGSKDKTKEEVREFTNVDLIVNEKNMGKSWSVATAIGRAKEDTILMLDADLIGLTPQDITNLIEPVFLGKADVSMSLRANSTRFYRAIKLDFVSGERVFRKKIVEDCLEEIKKIPGYGLETYLNRLIVKRGLRIKIVDWRNVSITKKFHKKSEKNDLFHRIWGEISMTLEILKVASVFEILRLMTRMLSLKIN